MSCTVLALLNTIGVVQFTKGEVRMVCAWGRGGGGRGSGSVRPEPLPKSLVVDSVMYKTIFIINHSSHVFATF